MSEREPGARDEDELWRAIVDNYGDRPGLASDDEAALSAAPVPGSLHPEDPGGPGSEGADDAVDDQLDPERFVAPDPPWMPWPRGPRLAAWLGVLLAPALMFGAALARLTLPGLVGLALVGWFVGGFAYLVVTMPRGPRDPGDDGAVV